MANTDIVDQWAASQDLPAWFVQAMAVPREEAFVEVDGARVHYFRWGKRGKPPLLMTHGFLAHARCFAFIAPFLAENYDIVAYDLAGMGDSEIPADCDGDKRATAMVTLAEALDLFSTPVKPKIIAHSFGSGVALTAAEQSAEISNKWAKETLAKMSEMAKAKAEPADYAKSMTDFASANAEVAAENMAAFAEIAKKVQMETVELMMAAGKTMQEDATKVVKKASDDVTAATQKATAAAK
jgi:hypothetical protein